MGYLDSGALITNVDFLKPCLNSLGKILYTEVLYTEVKRVSQACAFIDMMSRVP